MRRAKSGIAVADVADLARRVVGLPRIRLRGLMCLPAIRDDFESQREPFARLRRLADQLRASGIPTDTLSMGMSGDYRAAIFEGATIVRIGTAVFGPQEYHMSNYKVGFIGGRATWHGHLSAVCSQVAIGRKT